MFLPTFGFFPNLGIFWYATLRFKKILAGNTAENKEINKTNTQRHNYHHRQLLCAFAKNYQLVFSAIHLIIVVNMQLRITQHHTASSTDGSSEPYPLLRGE